MRQDTIPALPTLSLVLLLSFPGAQFVREITVNAVVTAVFHHESKLIRCQLDKVGAVRPVTSSAINALVVLLKYEMGNETSMVGFAHPAVDGFGY